MKLSCQQQTQWLAANALRCLDRSCPDQPVKTYTVGSQQSDRKLWNQCCNMAAFANPCLPSWPPNLLCHTIKLEATFSACVMMPPFYFNLIWEATMANLSILCSTKFDLDTIIHNFHPSLGYGSKFCLVQDLEPIFWLHPSWSCIRTLLTRIRLATQTIGGIGAAKRHYISTLVWKPQGHTGATRYATWDSANTLGVLLGHSLVRSQGPSCHHYTSFGRIQLMNMAD